ncbi:AraC family transcriptional regulator [Streptomyces carminius]|uniref:AraC family transcriptional regulator n=1 Tax=Streptomyces carminius TaxID=2665496 RepID=A0A2M8LTT2_9ACTN|nr:helix-turn-helix domain-containing protein [Streptomyces carminius]PJE95371.1 AraC family transcriptional regulator [Streptomyces carminius]
MHVVAVPALRGAVGFDLTTVCQVFASVRLPDGSAPYEVRVCADAPVTTTAMGMPCFELTPTHPLAAALDADTVVVPGVAGPDAVPQPEVVALLRKAAAAGRRVASICTGAFLLAEAGLLDGAEATTHWLAADRLAQAYPGVRVRPAVLFVDNGRVLTSAGVAAGLDLCLHLVSRDHGAAVAARAARALVVPLRREGGQAQFVSHPAPGAAPGPAGLQDTLEWLHRNLHRTLPLADIAGHAGLSVRSLNRHFRAQTGTTPLRWLLWARVERARELLETTGLPVERVAGLCGFGTAVSMRAHFHRRLGTSPAAYRRTFRAPVP